MKPGATMGRPPGSEYPHAETLRLSEGDAAHLTALAAAWGCSRSEVVRRLLGLVRAARAARAVGEDSPHNLR